MILEAVFILTLIFKDKPAWQMSYPGLTVEECTEQVKEALEAGVPRIALENNAVAVHAACQTQDVIKKETISIKPQPRKRKK